MTAVGEFDVAVVGGGAAGLWSALRAAELGARVCLVSRTPLSQSASYWAQGGLAAALEPDDSPERHAADTIAAGRGLCRTSAVRALVEEAPGAVRDLIARGVVFDLDHEGRLALGLEGGHTYRRIVHAGGSQTGYELTSKLAKWVDAEGRVEVKERTSAVALWSDGERCHGVITDAGAIAAPATILATGGAAALWRRTTNPRGAIGAGPVLASLAGADLADLEFCQFHPTALALPGTDHDGVLITEAIRGEGAKLLGADGERFTDELAPRDAVTAAILEKMRSEGTAAVDLDLREIDPARFPNVFASLARAGLNPGSHPVPVAPAAHYTMGGIAVDVDGRSSLPGLYAVGECSCTGLHGANRLASNSLSECFVFGGRAAAAAIEEEAVGTKPEPPQWRFEPPSDETRDAVWRYAGPMRNPDDLARLISNPYPLARAIGASALDRAESRGGHLRRDRPDTDPALDGIHVVVHPDGSVTEEEWH
ncbi:MAG: FAD-dependent oxidoreductase [Actinobacteria bacterium]|nr:MAG: FAD-dependent oxidoreductase [Actinomycetota bacterium]